MSKQTKEEILDDKINHEINENEAEEAKKEEPIDFLKHYVDPHKKISREVGEDDLERVLKDAHILYNLCFTQSGKYGGALAVAHQQINDKDPLRFFVTKAKKVVINPKIIRHTQHTVDSMEGCLSFPSLEMKIVQRWNKCEVKYFTIDGDGKKLIEKVENLNGREAKVWQHEIDHMDAKYIFKL